jgi:hypothetical protein
MMGERSYKVGEYAEKVLVSVGEGGKWTAWEEGLWSSEPWGYLGAA